MLFRNLRFADDAALLASPHHDLQHALGGLWLFANGSWEWFSSFEADQVSQGLGHW